MNQTLLWTVGLVATGFAAIAVAWRLWGHRRRPPLEPIKKETFSQAPQQEMLDEMIEDSFPASDPPAHSTMTAAGGPWKER